MTHVSAFTVVEEGSGVLFLEHSLSRPHRSTLRFAEKKWRPNDINADVTSRNDTYVALRSQDEDLLRHVDFIHYQGSRLFCGRQHTYLWMDIDLPGVHQNLHRVPLINLPARLLATGDANQADVHSLLLNPFTSDDQNAKSPEDDFIVLAPKDIPPQYMYGDCLIDYTSEIRAVPFGLQWYLRFGTCLEGKIQLALVWDSPECHTVIFKVTTHSRGTYFRLDCSSNGFNLRRRLLLFQALVT
ncbi:hypothetical protein DACRYDRAFT_119424 [Dacryopinax primogenitus]|uniref:Uncharacterized protein n=1 Tax=Dacryopinax primogenitus (strain DJM 731) TaxID=1858805 RepID=M5G0G5_DACPD|nr:uncharacterized protein DACRYDRAFT_119424 [Dacryopinax primogenitus]EJT97292.1 hypothetical protein DACRYDRAFT_119424 [Dacryopinax primogenitus]